MGVRTILGEWQNRADGKILRIVEEATGLINVYVNGTAQGSLASTMDGTVLPQYSTDSLGNITLVGPSGNTLFTAENNSPSFSFSDPTKRPPRLFDNSSAGYSISSVWQYGGKVYITPDYCAADSAAWKDAFVTPQAVATDIVGVANAKFAGGTVAMVADYTGNAIDIAVTIGGKYQMFTIKIMTNGELDNASLGAAIAQADAGTYIKVTKIYDHNATANHCALGTVAGTACQVTANITTGTTFAITATTGSTALSGQLVFGNGIVPGTTFASGTSPNMVLSAAATNVTGGTFYCGIYEPPYLEFDPVVGRYVIIFPWDPQNAANHRLQFPQSMTITASNAVTMYAIGAGQTSGGGFGQVLASIGDFTIAPSKVLAVSTPASSLINYGQVLVEDLGANPPVSVGITDQPMCFMLQATAGSYVVNVNENSATYSGSIPNTALAGGWLGTITAVNGVIGMMKLTGIAIFNSTVTAQQAAQLRYSAYSRMNIFPQVQNQVVVVGDSRFAESYCVPYGFSNLLARQIGRNFEIINTSASGKAAADYIGDGLVPTVTGIAASLLTLKKPGKNYAVVLIGVNDFIVKSSSVATALSNIQTLCKQITAVGYTVILVSELATSNTSGNANTNIPLLHSAIQAQGPTGMNCSKIVDVTGYSPVMNTGTTYYNGGLHPYANVYSIIASAVAPNIV